MNEVALSLAPQARMTEPRSPSPRRSCFPFLLHSGIKNNPPKATQLRAQVHLLRESRHNEVWFQYPRARVGDSWVPVICLLQNQSRLFTTRRTSSLPSPLSCWEQKPVLEKGFVCKSDQLDIFLSFHSLQWLKKKKKKTHHPSAPLPSSRGGRELAWVLLVSLPMSLSDDLDLTDPRTITW